MKEQTSKLAFELLFSRRARRSDKPTLPSSAPIRRLPNGNPEFRGTPHIHGVKDWLLKLGHNDDDLNALNVIHVAGTKGKGSTCSYIDSFLGHHGARTGSPKTRGLYTSPYLLKPNEMIRINNKPISDECFRQNFFEVWDGLGLRPDDTGPPKQLQLLFILSVHIFIKARVDVAIIETHHGGEFDVTNVIPRPVVTAVTSIGRDHLQELGGTIENIAWHKGGIFKAGSRALSVRQDPTVIEVLRERAKERSVDVRFVEASDYLPGHFQDATQVVNASLAKEACDEFLRDQGSCLSHGDLESGIRDFSWPGRLQVVERDNVTWCLDGAHNPMSVKVAARWFRNILDTKSSTGVLVFGLDGDRHEPLETLACLRDSIERSISAVILTSDTGRLDRARLSGYAKVWESQPHVKIIIAERDHALKDAQKLGNTILVTGSLWLVSYALQELNVTFST